MPNNPVKGNGASISFGSSTFDLDIVSMTLPSRVREALETSHLGTTDYKTFIPAALTDNGEISMTTRHDSDFDTSTIGNADAETVTITMPLPAGKSTPATWSFSAFVTENGGASVENDSLVEDSWTLKISGGITVTASA